MSDKTPVSLIDMPNSEKMGSDRGTSRVLTGVVTRLRRTLRSSIRADYPWETLPMSQIELLMALQDNQPSRIGELANQLRLAPNTVSGLVQQLVDAGLVHRGRGADRRVAVVTIAPAGDRQLHDWDHGPPATDRRRTGRADSSRPGRR